MKNKVFRVEIVGGKQDGLVFGVETDSNNIIQFGMVPRGVGKNIHDVYNGDGFKVSDVTGYDLRVALKNVRGYVSSMEL